MTSSRPSCLRGGRLPLANLVPKPGVSVRRFACPTRRLVVAALVPLAVGVSACSGGGDAAPTTGAMTTTTIATTTTTVAVPSVDELRASLLTPEDLPPGWTVESAAPERGQSGGPAPVDADDFLCASATKAFAPPQSERGSIKVHLTQGEGGPFLLQVLAANRGADQAYAAIKAALVSCVGQQWTADGDDEPIEMTMAEVPAPQAGTTAVAVRITGKARTLPLTMLIDYVLVQRSTVVGLYMTVNVQSSVIRAKQLSADDVAAIVATGDQKVAAALG
jgi:hypothetical protein